MSLHLCIQCGSHTHPMVLHLLKARFSNMETNCLTRNIVYSHHIIFSLMVHVLQLINSRASKEMLGCIDWRRDVWSSNSHPHFCTSQSKSGSMDVLMSWMFTNRTCFRYIRFETDVLHRPTRLSSLFTCTVKSYWNCYLRFQKKLIVNNFLYFCILWPFRFVHFLKEVVVKFIFYADKNKLIAFAGHSASLRSTSTHVCHSIEHYAKQV